MTRILLVDDDYRVRFLLADALREAGHTVGEAESAEAALAWIETSGPPALLITDVGLGPGMDGFALSAAVRVQHPALPVLLISGYVRADVLRPFASGERFLTKPFSNKELLGAICELLPDLAAPGP